MSVLFGYKPNYHKISLAGTWIATSLRIVIDMVPSSLEGVTALPLFVLVTLCFLKLFLAVRSLLPLLYIRSCIVHEVHKLGI